MAHALGERVHTHGAGWTDAGVHAEAWVAHLDAPESRARADWQLILNTLLLCDVRIADAVLMPDTFHVQHSAVRKTYKYRLWLSRCYTSLQLFLFVWACGPVDVECMDEGSRYLLGKRGFTSLKDAGADLHTTVRIILSVIRIPGGQPPEDCLELTWHFEADGFLKQMACNTMGLLVAVGRGKLEPADILGILDACDRRIAPLTAPACGLTVKKVWCDNMFSLAAFGHKGA